MLPDIAASAIAADSLGYHGIAQLIVEQEPKAPAIARMFAMSAARDHGMAAAIGLLAGSTARFNAQREGWNGDLERDLAIEALGGEGGASLQPTVRRRGWFNVIGPRFTAEAQSPAISPV
jgi:hypothetical protein